MEKKLLNEIRNLGIKEFESFKSLNIMDGSFLNLEVELPSGQMMKLLDDNKKYYANQMDIAGSDTCYGVAADDHFIAVYKYGCGGRDAELVLLKRI